MRDHKGYELLDKPLDWQDRLVIWACCACVVALGVLILGGCV